MDVTMEWNVTNDMGTVFHNEWCSPPHGNLIGKRDANFIFFLAVYGQLFVAIFVGNDGSLRAIPGDLLFPQPTKAARRYWNTFPEEYYNMINLYSGNVFYNILVLLYSGTIIFWKNRGKNLLTRNKAILGVTPSNHHSGDAAVRA